MDMQALRALEQRRNELQATATKAQDEMKTIDACLALFKPYRRKEEPALHHNGHAARDRGAIKMTPGGRVKDFSAVVMRVLGAHPAPMTSRQVTDAIFAEGIKMTKKDLKRRVIGQLSLMHTRDKVLDAVRATGLKGRGMGRALVYSIHAGK